MKTFSKLLGAAAALTIIVTSIVIVPSSTDTSVPAAFAASSDYFLKLDGIDGEIAVESFSWGVVTPRDAASGQASGKRQYEPIIIRKRIDKTSPLLFRLTNDKPRSIKKATLVGVTVEGQKFEISFFDVFADIYRQSGEAGGATTETLSFSYQKIEWK